MSLVLKANFKGLKEASDKIRSLRAEGEIARRVAAVLEEGTLERFDTQKDPEGEAWAKTYRGGKILNFHGFLVGSIVTNEGDDFVEIGSNLPYAAIHQTGGTIKAKAAKFLKFKSGGNWCQKESVTIKARAYLGISKLDEIRLNLSLTRFFSEKLS